MLASVACVIGITQLRHSSLVAAFHSFIAICFFIGLYIVSRRGFYKVASFCLIGTLFVAITLEIYHWGADLPSALLSYALIIVMAGILINTRFAFIATLIISGTIMEVGFLQGSNIVELNTYWKKERVVIADFIVFSIIFLIIATVSWLSNREIERSLRRARKSEAALKQERDSLEIIVEEKTRELKEMHEEKMSQLYRFAEFGRLSSGLFHDLVNPLAAVSLNMEKIHDTNTSEITEAKKHIERAILATKKMENMVAVVRKQLAREETHKKFSINKEILDVIEILRHKTISTGVKIKFKTDIEAELFGDPTRFHHAILNLASNGIDAYNNCTTSQKGDHPIVTISLKKNSEHIALSVKDWGTGITPENITKIFEPFFTTKTSTRGIGIGLSATKRIIEKDFGGTLEVESRKNNGSTFTIKIPKNI